MVTLAREDPVASTLMATIRAGDLEGLERLLGEQPGLAAARIAGEGGGSRTLLHIVTDWPGHFPNAAVVRMLLQAGADPNLPVEGSWHAETPLHWAASSDDVEVLDALLDGGADIEAQGASIGGGSPLDDAVGYGQWRVARRLVERGARTRLRHAAALGLMDRVEEAFASSPPPTRQEVTEVFWQACHGGQRQVAEYLLGRGADLNWAASWDGRTPLDIARNQGAEELVDWLGSQGARSAGEPG
ncbi:MAG TPA: ankyrin repeat domain-containing protein [Actinomycetes bacterium]|jgi:ankyrin repeat protein|nr:ankyrin repeat domain-containing protein [Actinomycetes bacterium]